MCVFCHRSYRLVLSVLLDGCLCCISVLSFDILCSSLFAVFTILDIHNLHTNVVKKVHVAMREIPPHKNVMFKVLFFMAVLEIF